MILPAQAIRKLGILTPCEPRTRFNGVTYGLGPAGYDLRTAGTLNLWPGHSVRTDAVEYFNMPNDVLGMLKSKSTWARLHIEHAGTVIEPGWRGILRLEINMLGGKEPITIPAGTGIVQVIFCRLEEPTEQPYEGKFQDQRAGQDAIFEDGVESKSRYCIPCDTLVPAISWTEHWESPEHIKAMDAFRRAYSKE